MSVVNFSIPKALEKRINKIISEKGFASKAEFFRYSAIHYIDVVSTSTTEKIEQIDELGRLIGEEVKRLYKGKKLPSPEEQLKDI